MSLLLDNLMDALPIFGKLTSLAIPHSLERQLLPPSLVHQAWDFLLNSIVLSSLIVAEIMHHWGLAVLGCAGVFLIVYGVQATQASRSTQDASVAKIKVWSAQAEWRGAAPVGCIVGGILLLLVGGWTHQLNLPGF
jgi:hypothetical protein